MVTAAVTAAAAAAVGVAAAAAAAVAVCGSTRGARRSVCAQQGRAGVRGARAGGRVRTGVDEMRL